MAGPQSITIVGGGLAGLTLGIGLRQQGVPVILHEAGQYPRHRVCGEFISGRGQAALVALGLEGLMTGAGAVSAQTAAFFTATRSSSPRPLPSPALCLSRFALDAALAEKFRALGGDVQTGQRVPADFTGEGFVRATGRRAQASPAGARWFGLKVHARNVPLVADLEMHVSSEGYVGLCRIENGGVNVCGLFRRRAEEKGGAKHWREQLSGPPGSPLRQRLAGASFDQESFCSIAGLALSPRQAASHPEICVGDAITMIPPVTGNGMSMAFEASALAVPALVAWSQGESSWADARLKIVQECDAAFAGRLVWARWLQRLVLTPLLQNPFAALAARSDWVWRRAFEKTR